MQIEVGHFDNQPTNKIKYCYLKKNITYFPHDYIILLLLYLLTYLLTRCHMFNVNETLNTFEINSRYIRQKHVSNEILSSQVNLLPLDHRLMILSQLSNVKRKKDVQCP